VARISIVIPAYNPGPYIRLAIQSVQDQTYADWELTIVDDGSTEDLSDICKDFPQATLIRIPHGGSSQARNAGIANSNCEFIAFLDCDDLWEKTKLEKQIELMDCEQDSALCHTDFDFIDASGTFIRAGNMPQINSYESLLQGPNCMTSSVMLRRTCLEGVELFDPSLAICEDYDLFLRIAHKNKITFLPACTASYRMLDQSLSRDYRLFLSCLQTTYAKQLLLATKGDHVSKAIEIGTQTFRKHVGRTAYNQCRVAVHNRKIKKVFEHLLQALHHNPSFALSSFWQWVSLKLKSLSRFCPEKS
jgi:glycosyltransferase involved in cell wall biosynthesis